LRTTIVASGEELLYGRTLDSNGAYMARRLGLSGFQILRHVTVGDSPAALYDELVRAGTDSDLIVMTGGLGPTADDRTRGAVARAAGAPLVEDAPTRRHVEERLKSFGRQATPAHLSQALFPAGSVVFPNPRGTAAGFACRLAPQAGRTQGALFAAMPGVPEEMLPMFDESVLPYLLDNAAPSGHAAIETLHLFPIGESDADERIADMNAEGRNPYIGITVGDGVITLSIRACGATPQEAAALVQRDVETIRERFGDLLYGRGGATLAQALSAKLERAGASIAVAESLTGGLVAKLLVDVPGMSRWFLGGVVAYADAAKVSRLGVPQELLQRHGAVSAEVAEAMARGACAAFGASLGVSTTGIAGPTGGSAQKPVGLVYVGVCLQGRCAVHRLELRGDRVRVRDRAAKYALNLARLALLRGVDAVAVAPAGVR
jgi:nicotinamide-nucleotide amidase